jgi:cytolysin-activating lysine-acyltransferase
MTRRRHALAPIRDRFADLLANKPEPDLFALANFKQVVKDKPVRIHPIVSQLVDPAVLEKMKVRPVGEADSKTQGA